MISWPQEAASGDSESPAKKTMDAPEEADVNSNAKQGQDDTAAEEQPVESQLRPEDIVSGWKAKIIVLGFW